MKGSSRKSFVIRNIGQLSTTLSSLGMQALYLTIPAETFKTFNVFVIADLFPGFFK